MILETKGFNQVMASSSLSVQATNLVAMYDARAPGYDAGNGGWHVELGIDFVKWIEPAPGASVLDLACGTGLVTIVLAKAVGPDSIVVGIDISPGMLEQAKAKPIDQDCAKITWLEHDITDLNDVEAVQSVVRDRGGFDIISCCSALVLLPDAAPTVRYWATLLKRGGRMIVDVPTEHKTLQHLFTGALRDAVGTSLPFDRSWVKDKYSLEMLYKAAGLGIDKTFQTRSYIPEKWYEAHEQDAVFDEQTETTYKGFAANGTLEKARQVWPKIWQANLRDNGKFWDGHPLYVTIGRRR